MGLNGIKNIFRDLEHSTLIHVLPEAIPFPYYVNRDRYRGR